MIFTEERSKRLNEYFNGIKIVKFNAWEDIVIYNKKVLQKLNYLNNINKKV
jgi:hypothetical protein